MFLLGWCQTVTGFNSGGSISVLPRVFTSDWSRQIRIMVLEHSPLWAPVNDKRPLLATPAPKPNPRNRDGKAARSIVDAVVGRSQQQVDEVAEVPLPSRPPRCGGDLEEEETVSPFQTEIPPPPRSSGLTFAFSWGGAGAAGCLCKASIHGKPRMRSGGRPPNWDHAGWRWPPN